MINQRHYERLSRLHRDASSSFYADGDVTVGTGKARVIHPIGEQDLDASRRVDPTVYHKLLSDAALLAAGSLVEEQFVTVSSFNYYVTQTLASGKLLAAAQVVAARSTMYTVNTVLTDDNGRVLAIGYGTYTPGPVALEGEPDTDASSEDPDEEIEIFGSFLETPFGLVGLN
ncbi:MAG: hypothetical protein R2834_15860 [Rhodothermales bacterium]